MLTLSAKEYIMSTLELQYHQLRLIISTIDQLFEKITKKAHEDADLWIRLFRNKKSGNHFDLGTNDQSNNTCSHNQAFITNLTDCFQQIGKFLQLYIKHSYGIDATTDDVFIKCYQKQIITKREMEMLEAMALAMPLLCNRCNEHGQKIISIELIEYYKILSFLIDRLTIL